MVWAVNWGEAHARERERKMKVVRALEERGVTHMPMASVRALIQADRPSDAEIAEITEALSRSSK